MGTDREKLVKAAERILKYRLHFAPMNALINDCRPLIQKCAGGWYNEAKHGFRQNAFPATRSAHQRDDFLVGYGEIDMVDCNDHFFTVTKSAGEVFCGKNIIVIWRIHIAPAFRRQYAFPVYSLCKQAALPGTSVRTCTL